MHRNEKLRNIAIIAHVDHGKTTLVDGLLWESGTFRDNQNIAERVMDSGDLEREKGITLTAKNASIFYKNHKINIVDTPGHADFGGEVERGLQMVDGALLLVDAAEGPLPQTRFVLKHALARGVKIAVVINKIDRGDARPKEVLEEIYELFMELNASDEQFDFPVIYAVARERKAYLTPDDLGKPGNLAPLLDLILSYLPAPAVEEGDLRMLVSNTNYSEYVGRLAVGKVISGSIKVGDPVIVHHETGATPQTKITALYNYQGLKVVPTEKAEGGDVVIVAGIEELVIGDSITHPEDQRPLPRIEIEKPTISIEMLVNNSPLAGRDGKRLTSRVIWDRLEKELRTNVSMQAERTDSPDTFMLKGRGELQFAILAEQMRREGYEFGLGRPKVITKKEGDQLMEPMERVVMDIPDDCLGRLTERLGTRKGEMVNLANMGSGRVRAEFDIPSRGLIGFRSEFLNVTRGQGLLSSYFRDYVPWKGHILDRQNGALVADRPGQTVPYSLWHLEERGKLFVKENIDVYEGMIIGENTRSNDMNVNVCREKKLTNIRAAGKDDAVVLTPVLPMTIEWAIAWMADDEVLEVTPNHLRLRKRMLDANKRSVIRAPKEEDE
jgi:GTP-binding protein